MRKVELRMKEQEKYEVIKELVDTMEITTELVKSLLSIKFTSRLSENYLSINKTPTNLCYNR